MPLKPTPRFTAIALAVVFAGALTLRAAPGQAGAADLTPWHCLACGPAGGADLLQNLLLFVPLGIALAGAGAALPLATIIGLLFSLAIELTQAYLLVGRDAALGDLVANTMGTGAGWLAGRHWRRWLLPTGRVAMLLRGAIVALFFGQLWLSGWLVAPRIDEEPVATRVAPAVPSRPIYRGSVVGVTLDGRPVVGAGSAVSRSGRIGPAVGATLTWESEATGAVTPIVRLEDHRGWVVAAIDRRDAQLGIEVRNRGSLLRLRAQTWVLPLPGPAATGDTITLGLEFPGGAVVGTVISQTGTGVARATLGAQHGWTLVNPFTPTHRLGAAWRTWTLAWLAGWGLLLGWWAAAARRSLVWGVVALVGCAALTALWHARASNPELLALAVGWLLGAISSGRCRRSALGP
jgi:hypothetical protein